MITRTLGVLAASAAMTVAALPAHAVGESVSVHDRLGEIAQVDDAVPVQKSPLAPVRAATATVGSGGQAVSFRLPVGRSAPVDRVDGRYVVPASDGASLAVAPTVTGAQILVGVESREAPTSYAFDVDAPAGFAPWITPDGGVEIADAQGRPAVQLAAPWALDAHGRRVPTRFELRGGAITQVVDHRAGDFAYPIVADPKIFKCDKYLSICVKFNKKETKSIAAKVKKANSSARALAAFICAKIPHPVIAIGCAGTVLAALPSLRKTFLSASSKKQCVELHFAVPSGLLWKWKKEKC